MSVKTRPSMRQATSKSLRKKWFNHVVDNVMQKGTNSLVYQAFVQDAGSEDVDIRRLLGITEEDRNQLVYEIKDPTDKTKILDTMDLPKADKNLILQFQAFIAETEDENGGDPMDDSEWLNLTSDDFDEFRSKWRSNAAMMPVINVSRNPLQDFQRGVKRDPAAFTVLKEIKQWDTWKRDTLAIASAQLIHDVFDEKYTPSGSTEKQLFRLQQNYVYSVFTRILKTDTGLELVRTHQDSKDAQAMFALLSKDAEKSATASLTSGDILTYITTARVGDGKWRGSVKSFIQHWSDQFRQYATLIPHADPFPDDMKLILLQNAVEPLPELRSVRQYAIQIELATGQSQTYEQYRSMVITAAETYDKKFAGKNRRNAFTHQLQDTAMIEEYEELPDYDVSTAISTIEVNAASLRQDMVPRDRWMQLDNETRTQWHRIPSNMQAIILGNQPDPIQAMDPSTPYNPGARTPPSVRRARDRPRPSRRPTRPDRRQASLANQVGEQEPPDEPQEEEYQQILDGVYSALEETAPERSIEVRQALFQALAADLEADPHEEETIIHCNAAQLGAVSDPSKKKKKSQTPKEWARPKSSELPAGDPCKVMSNPKPMSKIKDPTQQPYIVRMADFYLPSHTDDGDDPEKDDLQDEPVYNVSSSKVSQSQGALIDRGANGGIAGNDIRIIAHTGRLATVEGINNHTVDSIPIVTCGGVVKSQ